jgi:hypothetical protein
MDAIRFNVNGRPVELQIDSSTPLLWAIPSSSCCPRRKWAKASGPGFPPCSRTNSEPIGRAFVLKIPLPIQPTGILGLIGNLPATAKAPLPFLT